ncbi:hypothetical protein M758_UG022300 [Ceratodon purpureus]|nr:hypothetical protein M758_UG022300 [Ceratodon purpureus]
MATRTSMPCMSPITKRANKIPTSVRKSKFRRSGRGRLHRGGGTLQMLSRIGARDPLTPVKAFAGSTQVSPLLRRRSQTRLKWHFSEERRPARESPESTLYLGYWNFPWSAERQKAAVVLQAQWRMSLAREQYRRVQNAILTVQRRWRESRRVPNHTYLISDNLIDANLAAESLCEGKFTTLQFILYFICFAFKNLRMELMLQLCLWEEMRFTCKRLLRKGHPYHCVVIFNDGRPKILCNSLPGLAGIDGQRSKNVPVLSIERLYDTNISAIQEEEIFDEFLSFLPCPDHDLSHNDLYSLLRTGSENRESHVVSGSPNLPESFIAGIAAVNNGNNLQFPLPTKTWNFDASSLDSPVCSPVKELTFARITIDGSLPPTPIKEWSSCKREFVKTLSDVPVVWDSSILDAVELHHSPTKDWASPLASDRKSAIFLEGIPTAETNRKHPTEWFTDLDELDAPESCLDSSEVTSISFSPPSDPNSESLLGFLEVSSPGREIVVYASRAPICMLEGSDCDVLPSHPDKEYALVSNSDLVVKSPVSVKCTACSSPKTIDISRWRDTSITEEDIDSFRLIPSATHAPTDATNLSLDSPLSPALEEEFLDELSKLFEGSPYPEVGPLVDISSPPAGPRRPDNDIRCSDLVRTSYPKALSRVCSGALGDDGFLVFSARKLDFNFENVDEQQDSEGSQEECCHNEHHLSAGNVETVREAHLRSSSPLSMLPNFTVAEPVISPSQGSDESFDDNGQSPLGMYEELDDIKTSRDSRSHSKRCQSTVIDFLQLVEQNLDTGVDGSEILRRGSERSPAGSPYTLQSLEPQLFTFEDEDNFCDKAVDGNVVVLKDTTYQGRDVLPDPFHSWDAATAIQSLSRSIDKSAEYDRYETFRCASADRSSTFMTPKVQKSADAVTRSCGAPNKSKPPLPLMSRRISFDQINYNSDEPFTPLDERKLLLPEKKVSARLLYNSPASPGSPFVSYSAALSSVERSSALSVSKKYFLHSPSRMHSGKCDSDSESVASPKTLHLAKVESSFEGSEKNATAKHARALLSCLELSMLKSGEDGTLKSASHSEWNDVSHYSCFEDNYEAMLKQRDRHRLWFPENLSGPLLLTNGAESTDCSFRKSTASAWDCGLMTLMTDGKLVNVDNSSPSFHDLCKLWDEECMDLVTRSLKYKNLMTDSNLLRHEVKMTFEKPDPTSPQAVAWEIQNIEKLKEKLENRETLKELIQQQRDTIYINIATNASMRERYRLYSKWGIRRMSRGRLRKVIYELLWKDPKRFVFPPSVRKHCCLSSAA